MPNCFTLTKKSEDKRAVFQTIDDEMRAHFGEPPDAERWLWGWYDSIGLALACGKTWDEIRKLFEDSPELLKVVDYLEERYVSDCWFEHK
jgi:hypothetical protein